MLHVLWYIIVGFIAGLIARAILPGNDPMGFIMTTVVGLVGAVLGGLIAHVFSKPEPGAKFHPAGFLMSIVGAIVVLVILRYIR